MMIRIVRISRKSWIRRRLQRIQRLSDRRRLHRRRRLRIERTFVDIRRLFYGERLGKRRRECFGLRIDHWVGEGIEGWLMDWRQRVYLLVKRRIVGILRDHHLRLLVIWLLLRLNLFTKTSPSSSSPSLHTNRRIEPFSELIRVLVPSIITIFAKINFPVSDPLPSYGCRSQFLVNAFKGIIRIFMRIGLPSFDEMVLLIFIHIKFPFKVINLVPDNPFNSSLLGDILDTLSHCFFERL